MHENAIGSAILLQLATMSDKSEIAFTKADANDDPRITDFSAVVPLDGGSDDYQAPEFVCPVVEVKPEGVQDVKQESASECDSEGMRCCVNVPLHRESDDYCRERKPLDRTSDSDSHHISGLMYEAEVIPEELQDMKEEADDEGGEDVHYSKNV